MTLASRIGAFEAKGDADVAYALRADAGDLALAAVVAILLWPFPLVRLTFGLPWAVHGPLIVAWVFTVHAVYLALSARIWGRTPVMYLLDLGLAGRPRPFGAGASLLWGLGGTVTVVPALLGARTLADPSSGVGARWSGLRVVATR